MTNKDPLTMLLIEEAGERLSSGKSYVWPNIPEKKLSNAVGSIAKGIAADDVLILIDATIFGSAKDGIVVTEKDLYFKEAFTDTKRIALKLVGSISFKSDKMFINSDEVFATAGIEAAEAKAFVTLIKSHIARKITPSAAGQVEFERTESPQVPTPQKKYKSVGGNLVEVEGEEKPGFVKQGTIGSSAAVRISNGSSGSSDVKVDSATASISLPDSDRSCNVNISVELAVVAQPAVSGVVVIGQATETETSGESIVKGCVQQVHVFPPGDVPERISFTDWLSLEGVEKPESISVTVRVIPLKCDWIRTELPITRGEITAYGKDRQDQLGRIKLRGILADARTSDDDSSQVIASCRVENPKSSSIPIVVMSADFLGTDGTVVASGSYEIIGLFGFRQDRAQITAWISDADIQGGGKLIWKTGIATQVLDPIDLDVPVDVRDDEEISDQDAESAESDTFFIRFGLSKGSGDIPTVPELSRDELSDLRRCAVFSLDWDTDRFDDFPDLEVIDVQVVYDGVTSLPEGDLGLSINDDEISGTPSPIIKFVLDRNIDGETFKKLVWGSSVRLWPASRNDADQDPFYFEDHNGYTEILSESSAMEFAEICASHGLRYRTDISARDLREGMPIMDMLTRKAS